MCVRHSMIDVHIYINPFLSVFILDTHKCILKLWVWAVKAQHSSAALPASAHEQQGCRGRSRENSPVGSCMWPPRFLRLLALPGEMERSNSLCCAENSSLCALPPGVSAGAGCWLSLPWRTAMSLKSALSEALHLGMSAHSWASISPSVALLPQDKAVVQVLCFETAGKPSQSHCAFNGLHIYVYVIMCY